MGKRNLFQSFDSVSFLFKFIFEHCPHFAKTRCKCFLRCVFNRFKYLCIRMQIFCTHSISVHILIYFEFNTDQKHKKQRLSYSVERAEFPCRIDETKFDKKNNAKLRWQIFCCIFRGRYCIRRITNSNTK